MSFINNGMMASQGAQVNSNKMLPYIAAIGPLEGSTATSFTPTMPAHQEGDILMMAIESSAGVEQITLSDSDWFLYQQTATGGNLNGATICTFHTFAKRARSSNETVSAVNRGTSDHVVTQIVAIRGIQIFETANIGILLSNDQYVQQTTNAGVTFNDNIDGPQLSRSVPGLAVYFIASASDSTTPVISNFTDSVLVNITEHSDTGNTAGNGGHIAIYSGDLLSIPTGTPANTTFTCSVNAGICAQGFIWQTKI
jgi:hypothetical protein